MLIRREHPQDIPAIHKLHAVAFDVASRADGYEADLVDALRRDPAWIGQLSLVAVKDEGIVAHVTCTRGHIGTRPALGLGPIAVAPQQQGRGIGTTLMHAILAAAEARDETYVCLVGEPDFYFRFGFTAASHHHITAPDPAWGDYFQARQLAPDRDDITGAFTYAAPFGVSSTGHGDTAPGITAAGS